jgi:hypothetical protein
MIEQIELIGEPHGPARILFDDDNRVALGARPSEGSSINRIRPPLIMPRPMPTMRRSPPESVLAIWLRRSRSAGKI